MRGLISSQRSRVVFAEAAQHPHLFLRKEKVLLCFSGLRQKKAFLVNLLCWLYVLTALLVEACQVFLGPLLLCLNDSPLTKVRALLSL